MASKRQQTKEESIAALRRRESRYGADHHRFVADAIARCMVAMGNADRAETRRIVTAIAAARGDTDLVRAITGESLVALG